MTSEGPEEQEGGAPSTGIPIHRVREPKMVHMSTRIRWFHALGYSVGEIHKYLGVRYQQVRNVITTNPKRAAREDLPPLIIELLDIATDVELMEEQALIANMAAQRASDRKERAQVRKGKGKAFAAEDSED